MGQPTKIMNATRPDAVEAFKTVWGAKHEGELDHTVVAVLTKKADGQMELERHDSTTKHLAWEGAALGGVLAVLIPPVGVGVLAASGAAAGGGAWIGHFWHQLDKDEIAQIGSLLEEGQAAIIAVAVNRKGLDIEPLLGKPIKSKVIEAKAGDLDAVFDKELAK